MKTVQWSILTLLVVLLTVSCSKPLTTSQQVIAVIRDMEARIEEGERRPFMNHVAEEFDGQNGQMTRDNLRGMVIYQLNRYQRLNAQLLPIRVTEPGEGLADANFRALITGGAGWLPENGQLYDFETHWIRQNGDWLLLKASWTPVPLEDVIQ
jgi:hypothetical protein